MTRTHFGFDGRLGVRDRTNCGRPEVITDLPKKVSHQRWCGIVAGLASADLTTNTCGQNLGWQISLMKC